MYACVFWSSLKQFTKDSVKASHFQHCPGNTGEIQESTHTFL